MLRVASWVDPWPFHLCPSRSESERKAVELVIKELAFLWKNASGRVVGWEKECCRRLMCAPCPEPLLWDYSS